MNSKEYTTKELAAFLNVHRNTIGNYIKKGWLCGHKVETESGNPGSGVAWVFTAQDVARLLDRLSQ